MLQLSDLISRLFTLVVEDEDSKKKKIVPLDQLKQVYDVIQSKLNDYKLLEKQLQKFESEVRKHIRDEYVMKEKVEEMQLRIDELEGSREELLVNTKVLINRLKRENEELYQKVKQITTELEEQKEINVKITQYQEKIKVLEQLTQQSTKVSNSKYSTLDNTSIFIGQKKVSSKSRITTNITPQRTRPDCDQSFKNQTKRLSQQYLQTSYMTNHNNNTRKYIYFLLYIQSLKQKQISKKQKTINSNKQLIIGYYQQYVN